MSNNLNNRDDSDIFAMINNESNQIFPKKGRPAIYSSQDEREKKTKEKMRAYAKKYYDDHKTEMNEKHKERYKKKVALTHEYQKRSKYSPLSQQNVATTQTVQ